MREISLTTSWWVTVTAHNQGFLNALRNTRFLDRYLAERVKIYEDDPENELVSSVIHVTGSDDLVFLCHFLVLVPNLTIDVYCEAKAAGVTVTSRLDQTNSGDGCELSVEDSVLEQRAINKLTKISEILDEG